MPQDRVLKPESGVQNRPFHRECAQSDGPGQPSNLFEIQSGCPGGQERVVEARAQVPGQQERVVEARAQVPGEQGTRD